jgi:UPF0042 nucleotide-binding protein
MASRFVIITGLSGAGKSTAAKCFEDVGYYCVDNLPTPLLEVFLRDHTTLAPSREYIAVVADVRAPGFAEGFPRVLDAHAESPATTLIFFEASEEILVRRFSETRRPHPLAQNRTVAEGIVAERQLMAELRSRADLVIDTGELSVHDLRRQIFRDFSPGSRSGSGLTVAVTSFGFKHGIPQGSDLLFDVRYLPNPHFVEGLREQTGLDTEVVEFLEDKVEFAELEDRITGLLRYLLPKYRQETRSYLTLSIGCTGGRHRSVAMAEAVARDLVEEGWAVQLNHRDIGRSEST